LRAQARNTAKNYLQNAAFQTVRFSDHRFCVLRKDAAFRFLHFAQQRDKHLLIARRTLRAIIVD